MGTYCIWGTLGYFLVFWELLDYQRDWMVTCAVPCIALFSQMLPIPGRGFVLFITGRVVINQINKVKIVLLFPSILIIFFKGK